MVEELERREGDETHGWTKAHVELFVPLTQDVQASRDVLAAHPRLIGIGIGIGSRRSGADPFVIALPWCTAAQS